MIRLAWLFHHVGQVPQVALKVSARSPIAGGFGNGNFWATCRVSKLSMLPAPFEGPALLDHGLDDCLYFLALAVFHATSP